ncbi:hypothetical protein FIM12_07560 [SAR202 cluster bacterium AD-804-J14_MRT_500m]|nr:hypothetical protein [SAR202 cluster bacterium AD-804-J14_MRT_500m]
MKRSYSICVATNGQGVFQSPDAGSTWNRVRSPFPLESRVGALVPHPSHPNVIFAGADSGIYRSDDKGINWKRLDPLIAGVQVFSMAIDPSDPDVLFAGTTPPAVFRSSDGGLHWERLKIEPAKECPIGIPRVTAVEVDPHDSRIIWAGVEIDGVYRSMDQGESWTRIDDGISDPDIHDIIIRPGEKSQVVVSTPRQLFSSNDMGESWDSMATSDSMPLPYCRALAFKEGDPNVIFLASGDSAIGESGGIQRSIDGGTTWQELPLPDAPNSPIWTFATHPKDTAIIIAVSHFGEIYATEDGGDTWHKIEREFSEIRDVAWLPN